jgi:hypothetical protein
MTFRHANASGIKPPDIRTTARSFVPTALSRVTARISGMKNAATSLRVGMTMAAAAITDKHALGLIVGASFQPR